MWLCTVRLAVVGASSAHSSSTISDIATRWPARLISRASSRRSLGRVTSTTESPLRTTSEPSTENRMAAT
jgi:hypothetical protein